MNCHATRRRFSAFLDGRVGSETDRLVNHLSSCAECRNLLEETRRAWDLVGTLPKAQPAPYLATRILATIRDVRTPRFRRWFEPVLFPATAVAATVIGLWLGSLAGGSGETTSKGVAAAGLSANGLTANGLAAEEPAVLSYLDHFKDLPSASLGEAYFNIDGQE